LAAPVSGKLDLFWLITTRLIGHFSILSYSALYPTQVNRLLVNQVSLLVSIDLIIFADKI